MGTTQNTGTHPLRGGCINEQRQIIFDDFTLGAHYFPPFILDVERSRVSVRTLRGTMASASSQLEELERLLSHHASFQKHHLCHIYRFVSSPLFGSNVSGYFSYPQRCPGYPGYAKVGRVAVDLGRWTLEQTVNLERSGSQCLRFVAFHCFLRHQCVLTFHHFAIENRQLFIAYYLRIRATPSNYFSAIVLIPKIDNGLCSRGWRKE